MKYQAIKHSITAGEGIETAMQGYFNAGWEFVQMTPIYEAGNWYAVLVVYKMEA